MSARKDALTLLVTAIRSGEHSDLFRTTETYRAGGEGKEKTDRLLGAVYGLLKDLLALVSNAPDLVRNTDIAAELKSLAAAVDFDWITKANYRWDRSRAACAAMCCGRFHWTRLHWRWNNDRCRLMVQAYVRQRTHTRALGDWPFRQLKANPRCGTVTALTRTEFSIKFPGDSARPAEPALFLPVQISSGDGYL